MALYVCLIFLNLSFHSWLEKCILSIPRVKKKSAGHRVFSYRSHFLKNNLPADIRQPDAVEAFKSKLKTHLYDLQIVV